MAPPAAASLYELGPRDRVLQFASIAFDAAVEEIFPILARGGTLVLRPDGMVDSAAGSFEACDALELTVLDLPTAYWHELGEAIAGGLALPERVRLLIIGGEPARTSTVRAGRARMGEGVRIV